MKPSLILLICLLSLSVRAQQPAAAEGSASIIDRGVKLHDEGKYKEAIQLYSTVSRNDSNYVWALYELGMSLEADSQHLLAKSTYEKALQFCKYQEWEREADLLTNYGSLLDDMGQPELALTFYDRGIKKFPEHRLLKLNKATTLLKMDRFKESEELLKELLLMSPYAYSAHYLLGLAALNQGKIAESFISFYSYLMVTPTGRYQSKAINFLSMIANNKQELETVLDKKDEAENSELNTLEQIILSKIALNENYKPLTKIDDVIIRQIQVVFEKLDYQESSENFWIQYYAPLYNKILKEGKFEPFINHCFSNVNIPMIQDYVKKEKKKIEDLIGIASTYFNEIMYSRQLLYSNRAKSKTRFYYEDGEFIAKGQQSEDGKKMGGWEYYHSKGNLKSKGNYDNSGERTGKWEYQHTNGLYEGEENYDNGQLHQKSELYFDNGNISSISDYNHGKQTGSYQLFYYMGQPKSTTLYKDGKLNGLKSIYFINGDIHFQENYQLDSLDGIYRSYYQNGVLEYELNYKQGVAEGPAIGYHENGNIQFKGRYSNNRPIDTFYRYHANGKLKSIEPYQNGVMEGEFQEFHPTGELHYKCQYKDGKAEGTVSYFRKNKSVYSKIDFKANQLQKTEYFNEKGEPIEKSVATEKGIEFKRFDEFGLLNAIFKYDAKGIQQGKETYYYTNGKLSTINYYADGELTDTSRSYYLDGKDKAYMPYAQGKREGQFENWHPNGQKEQQGWYKNGEMEGVWEEWDMNGRKTSETSYSGDNLHGFKTEYWINGKPSVEYWYQYGWLITISEYDSLGNLKYHTALPTGNASIVLHHPNGKVSSQYQMVKGFKHGKFESFYFDGKPQMIMFYRNGLNDSIFKRYEWSGQLNTEGQFKNGKKVGAWKYYNDEGKLTQVENYLNDELHGINTYYHPSTGKILTTIQFEHGMREGRVNRYDSSGQFIYGINYEADQPISYTYLNASGNQLPPIPLQGGNGKAIPYYSNGKPAAKFEYSSGKLTGEDIEYYPNGNIGESRIFIGGLTHGVNKKYAENGKLLYEYHYQYDQLHGPFVKYYPNGKMKEEGHFYNNELHGDVIMYDQNGKKKQINKYYNGLLIEIQKL